MKIIQEMCEYMEEEIHDAKKYIKKAIAVKSEHPALAEVFTEKGIYFTGGVNSPYIWLECPGNMGSWEFFDSLLTRFGIVGTPGEGFGENGAGYFRLTAFGSKEDAAAAVERLKTRLRL